MKKIMVFASLLLISFFSYAQVLPKLKERIKQKVEARTNEKVDKTVDSAFNKTERKVDNTVKGKPGAKNKNDGASGDSTKKDDATSSVTPTSIKAYSKYDFVPGEKIIVYEDFANDAIGDFPDKWNTNSSGEVVTIEGKPGHWFMLTKHGVFIPEFIDSLPDNFTFEFDLLCDELVGSWGLNTNIAELENRDRPEDWGTANNRFTFNILPGGDGRGSCSYERRKNSVGEAATSSQINHFSDKTRIVHVALWRQKERMRLYLNEEKVFDLPKAVLMEAKFNSVVYSVQLSDGKSHFLMTNLRLAVGAPDTRNKILTQNKWVTHGILFDVNSANIKPESYGTLKEMANVLKENPDLKVMIVGHTDADGKDADNLDLSKRRAASVKTALAKEFGIGESRMETDGKGEGEPIDKNDNPAGKANNRRVEFIKL